MWLSEITTASDWTVYAFLWLGPEDHTGPTLNIRALSSLLSPVNSIVRLPSTHSLYHPSDESYLAAISTQYQVSGVTTVPFVIVAPVPSSSHLAVPSTSATVKLKRFYGTPPFLPIDRQGGRGPYNALEPP